MRAAYDTVRHTSGFLDSWIPVLLKNLPDLDDALLRQLEAKRLVNEASTGKSQTEDTVGPSVTIIAG
jgi:hypothetical protein